MIQKLLENQIWQDSKTWRLEFVGKLAPEKINVLSMTTSLTRFLERKYGLKLDVHVHDQGISTASEKEALLLKISVDDRCLRRKVSLMSRNQVMFDAESVLPLDVLPVELMRELEVGKRPLANLLSDRGLLLSRSDLSVSHIQTEGFYDDCWARCSVLSSESGAKALVTEVFHDSIWRKLQYILSRS